MSNTSEAAAGTQRAPGHTSQPGQGGPSRRKAVLRAVGLIAVVVAWLAIAGVGGPAIGSLSTVQENDQESFLPTGAESVLAAEAAEQFSDSNSFPAFVVFSTGPDGGPATPEQLASWQAFSEALPQQAVTTAGADGATQQLGTVGEYLVPLPEGAPPGVPQIIFTPSEDGEAALALVPLETTKVSTANAEGEPPLGPVVESIRAAATANAAGGQAHVTGPAGLIADLGEAFAGIDGLLLLVTLCAVLVILFLVYRAIALPFVVLFTAVSSLAAAGGVVYLLAANDVIKLNGQSQGILFILVIGAATDYALLLVARYREELLRVESRFTAMARAWRACVEPIAASAGTVIIGLLCLLLSDLNSNKSLGPVGAIGIAAALIGSLTLLPSLLMAGRWLFWPRIPHAAATASPAPLEVPAGRHELPARDDEPGERLDADAAPRRVDGAPRHGDGGPVVRVPALVGAQELPATGGEGRHAAGGSPDGTATTNGQAPKPTRRGIWGVVADAVARRPRRIWVITLLVLAACCLAVPTLNASGTSQTDVFLTDVDSIAGQEQLVEHFPGGSGNPVVIIAPETATQDVLTALGAVGGVQPNPTIVSAGPPGPPGAAPAAPPLVVDGRVQIQATLTESADSEAGEATVEQIRSTLHALPGGDQILVGGNTAIQLDTNTTSAADLRVIIPAILLAVLLVLILLLRSLVAPLLLVFATVVSFGAALGVSALVFNNVFDFPGSDPSVPLFAFVFLVALGIDYSIFLMTRAREEVALHGPRDGVVRALRVTGGVITSAGIVLAVTFAALAVIPILFLAQIAFIVAFGVLLDTLVVRTLLVPALAVDLGARTWWPVTPKPSRHQRHLLNPDDAGPDAVPGSGPGPEPDSEPDPEPQPQPVPAGER